MDHEGLRGLIHSFTPYYCTVIATVASTTGLCDGDRNGYSAWSILGLLVYLVFSITRCLSRNSG